MAWLQGWQAALGLRRRPAKHHAAPSSARHPGIRFRAKRGRDIRGSFRDVGARASTAECGSNYPLPYPYQHPTPCSCLPLAETSHLACPHPLPPPPYSTPSLLREPAAHRATVRAAVTSPRGFGAHSLEGIRQAGVLRRAFQSIGKSNPRRARGAYRLIVAAGSAHRTILGPVDWMTDTGRAAVRPHYLLKRATERPPVLPTSSEVCSLTMARRL